MPILKKIKGDEGDALPDTGLPSIKTLTRPDISAALKKADDAAEAQRAEYIRKRRELSRRDCCCC